VNETSFSVELKQGTEYDLRIYLKLTHGGDILIWQRKHTTSAGRLSTATIVPIGNEWYRCILKFNVHSHWRINCNALYLAYFYVVLFISLKDCERGNITKTYI